MWVIMRHKIKRAFVILGIAVLGSMAVTHTADASDGDSVPPGGFIGSQGGSLVTVDVSQTDEVTSQGSDVESAHLRACKKRETGEVVDCQNEWGWWSDTYQNHCQVVQPPPAKDHWSWAGHSDGVIITCKARGVLCGGNPEACYLWAPAAPGAGPSARAVAENVIAQMLLYTGPIRTAPPELERIPDSKVPFGSHVWLALARGENTTGPMIRTGNDGSLSVTVEAKLARTDWELRRADPSTQGRLIAKTRCEGPNAAGTIYEQGMIPSGTTTSIHSPTCDFNNTSYKKAGHYTITAHSTWEVTWTASNGENGTFTIQTPPQNATINIVEYQALNTAPTPQNIYPPLEEQDSHDK